LSAWLVGAYPRPAKASAQRAAMLCLVMLGLSCIFLVGLGVALPQAVKPAAGDGRC
jgi:hypothetical protein